MKAIPLMVASLLVFCTMPAHALKFPPGNGSCTDTLDIADVQHSATCRPGTTCAFPSTVGCDSVYGVKGIVTGIKDNGTSRTFYMQSRRAVLDYTGMDVFNGNGLYNGSIQIGDSVSVSGKVEEGFAKSTVPESGETEISGFDGSSGTITDLPTNILTSGNSLPPFHELTIANIRFPSVNYNSNSDNGSLATGEPWEDCLVKVKGPLVVGLRAYDLAPLDTVGAHETWPAYPGLEVRSPGGGGFLCYKQGSPGDSIYIDMTSFVTMTPPKVGTVIDSVFGILQQTGTGRSGAAGIISWRVAVRSAAPSYSNGFSPDIYVHAPPGISECYAIANDSVKVVFDQSVTSASATIPSHYNLTVSGTGIDYVHMLGANAVVCHLASAITVGAVDEMSATLMTGAVNGLTQNDPQLETFVTGVMTIMQIQAPDTGPNGLGNGTPVDRSNYSGAGATDGPRLTFTGVCTGRYFSREYYLQDGAGGARSGIKVFQPGATLTVGHKYMLSGPVTEFLGETECNAPPFVRDLGVVAAPPFFTGTLAQLADFTADVGQSITNGEDYEGCLVNFSENLRTSADAGPAPRGGFFHVTNIALDPPTIEVDCTSANVGGTGYDPNPNEFITAQGPLSYRFSAGDLFPRVNADVVKVGQVDVMKDPIPAVVSFSVAPNPASVVDLTFTLPRRDQVDLGVYDVRGRRLATIARGSFASGRYIKSWDGRLDKGGSAGTGVFFYRLKVGEQVINLRGVRMN